MENKKFERAILIAFLTAINTASFAQDGNRQVKDSGTQYSIVNIWQLDVAASEFNPGPGWKQQTRVYFYTADKKKVKMVATGTREDCTPILFQYTAIYDGKDYPISGNPKAETLALTRLDDNTTTGVTKRAGVASQTTKSVVSVDGLSMTVTTSGTDERGIEFHNHLILRKVSH